MENRLRLVTPFTSVTMADISAENCVRSLKQAQEDAFNTLEEKAKDDEWLKDFLTVGGLEVCNYCFCNKSVKKLCSINKVTKKFHLVTDAFS